MPVYQIGPNRWSTRNPDEAAPARSSLPMPFVISDEMPPTEQVDGRYYTSKAAFRATGRALGLTEVGNEKPKPKVRASESRAVKDARQRAIKRSMEKMRSR
jgi:hypothetical protein